MNFKDCIKKITITLILAGSLLGCCSSPAGLEGRMRNERIMHNSTPDKYAFLISGESEYWHRANISLIYNAFLRNDFRKENIYILDHEGEKVYGYPVDGSATKENIKKVFVFLKNKIDEKDLLFVYTTDHGGRIIKDGTELSTLVLPGPDLDQKEFSEYIKDIIPKLGIFLFDQCYSGGFAEELAKKNYVAIASTKSDEKSFGEEDSFGSYFILASFNNPNADLNNDGKTSLKESFEYSKERWYKANDKYREVQEPVIIGKNLADKTFLNN